MAPSNEVARHVDAIRAFNRYYTRRLGLLDRNHLRSDLGLAEVRLLFELAHGTATSPGDLARDLALDAGYVSRLVRTLERLELIVRTASTDDGRRSILKLTAQGRRRIAGLESATRKHLAALVADVPSARRSQLVGAMRTIEDAFEARSASRDVRLREPLPGDIGWIIHRQAALYAEEYGWDWTFEGLLAQICGDFVKDFDAQDERCWVATVDGAIVGSVFLVRKSARVAQLRMLYVEPSARGLGIGTRLVNACIDFARERDYRRMTLWTNDILGAARKIYQGAGFVLVKEEKHRSFGKDLVGQNWDLDLR